jgi:tetratricopeptide (TPR) repeat protein
MKKPVQADMQRWSDEVARDPRSLAFLPLARAYRRQGLREQALQLCLRGLEAYPAHADAHGLLALLYLEKGDVQRAADEWSMVLRIDPDNFEGLRGMGFCYLEQDQLSRARHSLERAALLRPSDPTVQEALRVLGTRQELAEQGIAPPGRSMPTDEPWADHATATRPQEAQSGPPGQGAPQAERGAAAGRGGVAWAGRSAAHQSSGDPAGVFDELLATGPLLGVLLIDGRGLVLAGRITEAVAGDASSLGAVLGGGIDEAARTVALLELGGWRGILLEAEHALLHLAPAARDTVLVLVARRTTPPGWVLRAAAQASEEARLYLEEYG